MFSVSDVEKYGRGKEGGAIKDKMSSKRNLSSVYHKYERSEAEELP